MRRLQCQRRKRAKNAPASQKEEVTKNILRAVKRAASAPPSKKKVDTFFIADPAEERKPSEKRRQDYGDLAGMTRPKNLRVS